MRSLRVGVLDFLTDGPETNLFQLKLLHPSYASVMPQCVAVWAEELGHKVYYDTYIGQNLFGCVPEQLDVLFLSGFSRASFLMYGVSQHFRKRGVVTVLGGPHARSFPEHAQDYFDYVCLMSDKALIESLLQGLAPQSPGIVLDTGKQPRSIPGVQARQRFIDVNVKKSFKYFKTVPVLGSFGCPYTCSFCIDASVPYQPAAYPALIEDLRYAQHRWGKDAIIGWHDPNFGVRFRDYMGLIEESGTVVRHVAESTLSVLSEKNLRVLKKNRFVASLPGIESWYEFSDKSGHKRATGEAKMRTVAAHINLIQAYVPYVQANFVLGLDDDDPEGSWELTKQFLDLAPGAFPAFSLFTNYRNAPSSKVLEHRTTHVPFPLLDGYSACNVKLKNYDPITFFDKLIDLMEYAWSADALRRRFTANQGWVAKLVNLGRSYTAGRVWRLAHYRKLRRLIDTDPSFRRFITAEQSEPPAFYFDLIKARAGEHANLIPAELLSPRGYVESVERTTFTAAAR